MSIPRTIRTLTVSAILLGMAAQGLLALAIDIPGTLDSAQSGIEQGEQTSGINLQTILATAGLNSEKYKDCVSPAILGQLANLIGDWKNQLTRLANDFIREFMSKIAKSFIYCAISDIQKEIGGSAGVSAKLLIRSAPQCKIDIKSDAAETAKNIKARELQSNFIARCIARAGMKNSVDAITKLMQQRGPYGEGPAWVTSWVDLPKTEERRAQARFWTILVNTDICPYMKDDVYSHFRVPKSYIDTPPSLIGIVGADGDDPFTLQARCTVPEGITPDNAAAKSQGAGYLALVSLMNQPQNNPTGFIDMAEGALAAEKASVVGAALADAMSGGGVRSIADCIQYGPDGTCLAAGPNKQTGGTVRDQNAAAIQAQYNWLTSTDGTQQKAIDDIYTSISNRLFDLSNAPLPLNIEFGPEDNPQFSGESPSVSPTPTPADDLECTGGEPRCTCVKNDPAVQNAIVPIVKDGIARAIQVFPDLFVNGTTQIAPGVDPVRVLEAICDRLQPEQGGFCEPEPGSSDEIVILTDPTISVDVITADGHVRSNGGQAVAACEPGVQD